MKKIFQNARVKAVKTGSDVTKVKVPKKRVGIEKVRDEEKERKRRKLDFVFGEGSISAGVAGEKSGEKSKKSGEESKKSKTNSFNINPSKSRSTDGSKVGRKTG